MKHIKEKIKDKKGMLSIEYMISLLIFLTLLTFTVDLAILSVKRNQMTKFSQTVVRHIRTQSGLMWETPTNFPGTDDTYLTSSEAANAFRQQLVNLGLPTSDAVMILEGTNIHGAQRTYEIKPGQEASANLKYQTPFKLTLKFKYHWGLFSSFMTDNEGTLTISTSGYTEYNQNADVWEGD